MTLDQRMDELVREVRTLRLEVAAGGQTVRGPALEPLSAIVARSVGHCRRLLRDPSLKALGVLVGESLMFNRDEVVAYFRRRTQVVHAQRQESSLDADPDADEGEQTDTNARIAGGP